MTGFHTVKYIVAIALLIIFPLTSGANATADDAEKFIKNISSKAISVIQSEKSSEIEKEMALVSLFEQSVDTQWIAKFAMGRHWNRASDHQKELYTDLYKKFLIGSYVPKFKEYTNQKIIIKKTYDEGDKEYLIETEILQHDGAAINVDYKVREGAGGKYVIFDVIAEGVSLITTQRSEFGSILSRKGVDYLIKKLKARV